MPKIITTLAALFIMALLMVAPAAHANTECGTPVLDTTDASVLDIERVTQAVNQARNDTGADIYVRAMQETPYGDSGVWWRKTYPTCPSWVHTDGEHPRANVLVIQFGLDRTSSINYGDNFKAKLDRRVDNIRGNALGNGLRDAMNSDEGDKREAFTRAVEQTLDATVEALHAPDSTPMDWGSIWSTVWKWVLGILITLGGIATAWGSALLSRLGFRKWKASVKEREDIAATRERIAVARGKASNAVLSVDNEWLSITVETDAAAAKVEGGVDNMDGFTPLDELKEEINSASTDYRQLSDKSLPADLEGLKKVLTAYIRCAERITSALNRARDQIGVLNTAAKACTVESKVSDLTDARDRVMSAIRELDDESPKWAVVKDITVPVNDAVIALDVLITGMRDGSEKRTRPEVDEIITDADNTESQVSLRLSSSLSADSRIREVGRKANVTVSAYSAPVADVPDDVRVKVLRRVQDVADRIVAYIKTLDAAHRTVPVSDVVAHVKKFEEELKHATAEGDEYQRCAAAERDAIRRAKEAEEAERRRKAEAKRREEQAKRDAERREREEEERRRRNTSFGAGYGAGYESGGGFGGGGSIGFGGGSSGSW